MLTIMRPPHPTAGSPLGRPGLGHELIDASHEVGFPLAEVGPGLSVVSEHPGAKMRLPPPGSHHHQKR